MIFRYQVDILEKRWKDLRLLLALEYLKRGVRSNKTRAAERSAMEEYFKLAMKYDVQINNFLALRKLRDLGELV